MLFKERTTVNYSRIYFFNSQVYYMKSSLIKLFPWCLCLVFLCWGAWSNIQRNNTSLVLFYVEQTNDRLQHKYDSVVSIKPNIYNSDGYLKSYPNRVIKVSGAPLVFTVDTTQQGCLSQKEIKH